MLNLTFYFLFEFLFKANVTLGTEKNINRFFSFIFPVFNINADIISTKAYYDIIFNLKFHEQKV